MIHEFLHVFFCIFAAIVRRFIIIEVLLLAGNDVISKCRHRALQVAGTSVIWREHTTSYKCPIVTLLLSCTVSSILKFTVDRKWRHIKMSTRGRFKWVIQAPTARWTMISISVLLYLRDCPCTVSLVFRVLSFTGNDVIAKSPPEGAAVKLIADSGRTYLVS